MQLSELRDKSHEDLNKELLALRREQFNLRMQLATGQLTQVHRLGEVRKKIARVKTVITEKRSSSDE